VIAALAAFATLFVVVALLRAHACVMTRASRVLQERIHHHEGAVVMIDQSAGHSSSG